MVAIASYHSGAHLMKPQFPVKLRTALSQGCHISYNLVTTLPLYTRLLLGCYNLVRLSTGCDNFGISIWEYTIISNKNENEVDMLKSVLNSYNYIHIYHSIKRNSKNSLSPSSRL